MRFALVGKNKVEAYPGLKGTCPGCKGSVVARCGQIRVHHWAHESNRICDKWWESETEWHRSWKDNFPRDWQEIHFKDEHTGENHIADICTLSGLVIEFQYSPINLEERNLRENFYENMVWVINGSNRKMLYQRFFKEKKNYIHQTQKGLYDVYSPEKCFPGDWLNRKVPVIFDLQRVEDDDKGLYCLFPGRSKDVAKLAKFTQEAFVNNVLKDEWSSRVDRLMAGLRPNV